MAWRSLTVVITATCFLSSLGTSEYQLAQGFVGKDFFNDDIWDFFTQPDPTTGTVKYVDKETAQANNMISATDGTVSIRPHLDEVVLGGPIPSVRIHSKKAFDSGLFVISVEHQPTGCGVWPAFWLDGEDASHPWPIRGEMDLLEGAHAQTSVFTTLHTQGSCDQSSLKPGVDFSGTWNPSKTEKPSTNCSVHAEDQQRNEGCSSKGPEGTMGSPFNSKGGGTFAFEWDPVAGHVRAYYFDMGKEPQDLKAKSPQPDTWGMPFSKFIVGGDACPSSSFLTQHIIINTDFCGDWGADPEEAFHQACPHVPKDMTCPAYVSANAKNLTEAYWTLKALDVYQKTNAVKGSGVITI